jgi:hypothetical protein
MYRKKPQKSARTIPRWTSENLEREPDADAVEKAVQ